MRVLGIFEFFSDVIDDIIQLFFFFWLKEMIRYFFCDFVGYAL